MQNLWAYKYDLTSVHKVVSHNNRHYLHINASMIHSLKEEIILSNLNLICWQ